MDVMLSDNMKRFLCRSGFMLLCVLPTLLCLKAVLFPPGCEGWQVRLQQQFGVINQIAEVKVHSPQRTDFRGLQFGADHFNSRLNTDGGTLLVQTDGTTLQLRRAQGSVEAFWATMQQIVETTSWSGRSVRPVTVKIDELTLLHSDPTEMAARGETGVAHSVTWKDLTLQIAGRGQQLSLQFVPRRSDYEFADEEPEPTAVSIERSLNNGKSSWLVNGVGFQLPTWTMRGLVTFVEPLGAHTSLADPQMELTEQNGLWSSKNISGRLLNVNLQDIVANRFGALLTGNARIDMWRVQLNNNQIFGAVGEVHSPGGQIGGNLLARCQTYLGMKIVEPYGYQDEHDEPYGKNDEQYNALRFHFEVDHDGVAFSPINDSNEPPTITGKAILIARQSKALLVPQAGPKPVSNLHQVLAWAPEQMNANTAALARYLPMAPIVINPDLRMERTADRDDAWSESLFKR